MLPRCLYLRRCFLYVIGFTCFIFVISNFRHISHDATNSFKERLKRPDLSANGGVTSPPQQHALLKSVLQQSNSILPVEEQEMTLAEIMEDVATGDYRVQSRDQPPAPKKADNVDRPWYMKGGVRRPQPVAISRKTGRRVARLWPQEEPGGDRVTNQLMFVPPDNGRKIPNKKILLFNGLGTWGVKAGSEAFKNCPVDSCTITSNRAESMDADAIFFKDHFVHPGHHKPHRQMSSPSSPSYILPDSPPPQRVLNYWQRKAAESCAASSAGAAASAPASAAPAPAPQDPTSPGGEIVIGHSPIQRLAPAPTWAPRRAVLTTLSNKIKQRQGKRKLTFEEPEVSGEEEDEVLTQSKKRAVMHEDSSLAPLIKEVEAELDFVQLINKPLPKPWVPLRELKEDHPYRIVAVREDTNKHGRRVILKIINAGSKCEVYLPQRFASCIDAGKIHHFNETCKNYVLVVTHKSPNWSDIKIVKA